MSAGESGKTTRLCSCYYMARRLQGCEQVGYVGVLSVSTRILQINLCLGFWYLLVTEIETLIKIQFQNYF